MYANISIFDNLQTRNSFIYIYIAFFIACIVIPDIPHISNKSPGKRQKFSSNDFMIGCKRTFTYKISGFSFRGNIIVDKMFQNNTKSRYSIKLFRYNFLFIKLIRITYAVFEHSNYFLDSKQYQHVQIIIFKWLVNLVVSYGHKKLVCKR